MTGTDRNKALVRRFVEAINQRDYEALAEVVAADFERHCPATPEVKVRSLDDFRGFLERDAETFPDHRVTLESLVGEGDLVAFWATYAGTQTGPMGALPASGHRAVVEFSGVFRVRAGRIAGLRVTWDNLALLTQLGHLTPPST